MMAMLWVNQILLGKKAYVDVPRLLKPKVKELLIDAGYEELVTEQGLPYSPTLPLCRYKPNW